MHILHRGLLVLSVIVFPISTLAEDLIYQTPDGGFDIVNSEECGIDTSMDVKTQALAAASCGGCRAPYIGGYTRGNPPNPSSGSCSYQCNDLNAKAQCIAQILAAFGITGDKLTGMCVGGCDTGGCVPEKVKNANGDGIGFHHKQEGNTCTYSYETVTGAPKPDFYATACGCHTVAAE